jgi:hypothetical protein
VPPIPTPPPFPPIQLPPLLSPCNSLSPREYSWVQLGGMKALACVNMARSIGLWRDDIISCLIERLHKFTICSGGCCYYLGAQGFFCCTPDVEAWNCKDGRILLCPTGLERVERWHQRGYGACRMAGILIHEAAHDCGLWDSRFPKGISADSLAREILNCCDCAPVTGEFSG